MRLRLKITILHVNIITPHLLVRVQQLNPVCIEWEDKSPGCSYVVVVDLLYSSVVLLYVTKCMIPTACLLKPCLFIKVMSKLAKILQDVLIGWLPTKKFQSQHGHTLAIQHNTYKTLRSKVNL